MRENVSEVVDGWARERETREKDSSNSHENERWRTRTWMKTEAREV